MEMQQDGSLKSAVQEALGVQLDAKTAVQQRIKQLLDSKPVMLFMKVSSCADLLAVLPSGNINTDRIHQYTGSINATPTKCMQATLLARTHG